MIFKTLKIILNFFYCMKIKYINIFFPYISKCDLKFETQESKRSKCKNVRVDLSK